LRGDSNEQSRIPTKVDAAPTNGFCSQGQSRTSQRWLCPAGSGNKERWRAAQDRGRRAQRASYL